MRPLEEEHGLSNGTINKIVAGRRKTVDAETVGKLSAALGIPVAEILRASTQAEIEAPPAASPTPPPTSTVKSSVTRDDVDRMIDLAWVAERHTYSDGSAVRELLRTGAPLVAASADGAEIFRGWLDAAAALRRRGEPATPSALLVELTRRAVDLERRVAELHGAADAGLRAQGHAPAAALPPAISALAAQKRARREG